MLKKNFVYGVLYLLIAGVFALGAIGKTISNDSMVVAMQWFCTVVFIGVSIWQFTEYRIIY